MKTKIRSMRGPTGELLRFVVLPLRLLTVMGWKAGDTVEFDITYPHGNVVLRKKEK